MSRLICQTKSGWMESILRFAGVHQYTGFDWPKPVGHSDIPVTWSISAGVFLGFVQGKLLI